MLAHASSSLVSAAQLVHLVRRDSTHFESLYISLGIVLIGLVEAGRICRQALALLMLPAINGTSERLGLMHVSLVHLLGLVVVES